MSNRSFSWIGSPVKSKKSAEYWQRSWMLLNRRPKDFAVVILEPGNQTRTVEVRVTSEKPVESWSYQEKYWLNQLLKLLRRLYPHRGQSLKKFGGYTLTEWVNKIGAAIDYELDEFGHVVEIVDRNRQRRMLEKLWRLYRKEYDGNGTADQAFRKVLLKHGMLVRKVPTYGNKSSRCDAGELFKCEGCGKLFLRDYFLANCPGHRLCIFCLKEQGG